VQPRLSTVWHTKQFGGAPDSVQCARLVSGELATLGKLWRRTNIIHRTVRWCTGMSGEPTVANAMVSRAIRGRRVARANGRLGAPDCPMCTGLSDVHRIVRCAPDSVRCANQLEVATVGCARNGRKSRTGHEQWLSGGTPECPVRHPTEGKFSLPRMPPTAPRCLGAIKGTSRRMEELPKHTLSSLSLPHSVSAHLIDFVSDLSSVLVVNSLCFIRAQALACVCSYCCGFVFVASHPYSCAFTLIFVVRARDFNLWRFLANGKRDKQKKNTVVFKLIIGSLERG
jgi:hypothetical protein